MLSEVVSSATCCAKLRKFLILEWRYTAEIKIFVKSILMGLALVLPFFFVCLQTCTQNMNQTPVDGRRIAHRFVWIWVNYNKLTATSLECLGIFQGIFSMFHDECHICE